MKKREKVNFSRLPFTKKDKKGTILVENIIFIILNMIFLIVLILFLVRQGSGAIVLEETYAKQIAMIADASQPIMLIKMDMSKGKEISDNNKIDFNKIISIDGNIVSVRLSGDEGYEYAFFNDVDVGHYPEIDDITGEYTGMYIFTINKKVEVAE
jgi:hypothetical protein